MKNIIRVLAVSLGILVISLPLGTNLSQAAPPSISEYVRKAGKGAYVVPPKELKFDGHTAICGRRPTVMNPKFDDYGGAYINANPGYIILNPKKLEKVSTIIKFYIYGHECGHQMRGESESDADCFSIRRGVRYGWLDKQGMDEICKFMWDHKADFTHEAGPERCKAMRTCFAQEWQKKRK